MTQQNIKQSFNEVWIAFVNTVKSAYKLAPFMVIIMIVVVFLVTQVAILSVKLMTGMVLLIVLFVAIIIYAMNGHFGEAALALVAGLIPAYTVTWTASKFIAFISIWSAFSFFSLLISSLKLASRSENLYKQAAIAISNNRFDISLTEKSLRKIGNDSSIQGLGPIEKAETLLIFAYRKLPVESQLNALKAVSLLSLITQLKPKVLASFIADAYKVFDFTTTDEQSSLVDILYETIKESPVIPADFIEAFEKSKRLILSREIHPMPYLKMLKKTLESGLSPDEVYDHIHHLINRNDV